MYYVGLNPLPYDVISIQSQVIYGTVGNNACIPALVRQGLTVCNVPTVLFSNTPHYPTKYGASIPMDWFEGFLKSLEERDILKTAKAIILGYLGGGEQADLLAQWLPQVKAKYPHIHIGIDPVLGDHDSGIYVKPEIAECYQKRLIACADLITPNHFELEFLTGTKSASETEVIESARKLLASSNIKTIIVTSSPNDKGQLVNLIVTQDSVEKTYHNYIDSAVKGTGDTFHATVTAELLKGRNLLQATQTAGEFVVECLTLTQEKQLGELFIKMN